MTPMMTKATTMTINLPGVEVMMCPVPLHCFYPVSPLCEGVPCNWMGRIIFIPRATPLNIKPVPQTPGGAPFTQMHAMLHSAVGHCKVILRAMQLTCFMDDNEAGLDLLEAVILYYTISQPPDDHHLPLWHWLPLMILQDQPYPTCRDPHNEDKYFIMIDCL